MGQKLNPIIHSWKQFLVGVIVFATLMTAMLWGSGFYQLFCKAVLNLAGYDVH